MMSDQVTKDTLAIKQMCSSVILNKNNEYINVIATILTKDEMATKKIVGMAKIDLLGLFVMTVRNSNEKKYKINEDTKIQLLKIASITLSNNKLDYKELLLFLNLFGSLIQEVYNLEDHTLKKTSEELMWEVLNCVKLLFEAVTEELFFILYTKENAMRLCKIIFVITEVLKHKSKKLKAVAIQCLMSMFRVTSKIGFDHLFRNIQIAQTLADTYSYFLPGIALALEGIVSEGTIVGGNILELTVEAMGKIMTILLKDYEEKEDSLEDAKARAIRCLNASKESEESTSSKKEDYLNMHRTWKWFKAADKHLVLVFRKFNYLTSHPSSELRFKLAEMCVSLIEHCFKNIPQSAHPLIEMLIIMSDNSDEKIDALSKKIFDKPILGDQIKRIVSEDFHQIFSRIPVIFNGIDTVQQVNILKFTSESLKIVGNKIKCNDSFREFQRTLLYLSEVEIGACHNIEVVSEKEFDGDHHVPPDLWKGFKFMREENVRKGFSELCKVLCEIDLFPILSDYLINIITFEDEKTEAFYLMNQLLKGMNEGKPNSEENPIELVMSTFETYIENWDIPLEIDDDECTTLKTLKINILQAALMCEGIGLMAKHAKGDEHLRPFLFNSMYKVLIRAASRHYTLRTAATKALQDMATGLGFSTISEMLNENMDFFLFYVERGLKRNSYNSDVFEVMEMVMKYGDSSILERFSDWVDDVLVQSFDKYKQNRIDSYLRVFKVFLSRLMKWYDVNPQEKRTFLSLEEKKAKVAHFEVHGAEEEITDFSDDIMGGKSTYEMYMEDMKQKNEEEKDEYVEPMDEPYKKPTPPKPIKITVEVLRRSLHFLPSKNTDRKLVVLEILRNGLEIIKDHEDELLPIVHLIWSPLVYRFKDIDSPVILNYSFQLLVTMGRVSKDFIRNRTSKDVMPNILSTLSTLSKKNNEDTSIYSLDYKLQLVILENMFSIIYDIELVEKDIDAILEVVNLYRRKKQPRGLRMAASAFVKSLADYNSSYKSVTDDAKTDIQ